MQQNHNYESKSMVLDGSSSMTSSGRFNQDQLLKLQRVEATADAPLPML